MEADYTVFVACCKAQAARVRVKTLHWIENDFGESDDNDYCDDCVPTDDDFTNVCSAGGVTLETDSPQWCHVCGAMLDHSITDYYIERELERLATIDSMSDDDCWIVVNMLGNCCADADQQKIRTALEPHLPRLMEDMW